MRIKKSSIRPIARTLGKELAFTFALLMGISVLAYAMLIAAPANHQAEIIATSSASTRQASSWLGYFAWLGHVAQGDLGTTLRSGAPVAQQIGEAASHTLFLIMSTLCVSLAIAVPLAISAATKHLRALSRPLLIALYLSSAVPSFWLAYAAIYLSTRYLNQFPVVDGTDITLPTAALATLLLVLGSGLATTATRQLSSELSRVLSQDYVTAAIAKGASLWRHAYVEGLLLPTLEIAATRLSHVIGACVVVEQVLNWPGLGRLVWQAAQERDTQLVMGAVLISALWVALAHLAQRTLYVLINPRASHMGH